MHRLVLCLIAVALVVACSRPRDGQGAATSASAALLPPPSARPAAPELPSDATWWNVTTPPSLAALRGHVVVVDFWTFCCANCLHVLPELAALEARFEGAPVQVIGVHSGKFEAEQRPERVRDAVEQLGVRHPVLVDESHRVWDAWGARAWPTLVVVDAEGRIARIIEGEPRPGELGDLVSALVAEARAAGRLASTPSVQLADLAPSTTDLRFPGKLALGPDGLVAVADTGHHRVVLLGLDGEARGVIGTGLRGLRDGLAHEAAFDHPRGVAFSPDGATLYVADTDNHAVRAVDLRAQTVRTLAGTGQLGRTTTEGGKATEIALRSPWDVLPVGGDLLVAMAGAHQLWRVDLASGRAEPLAGTGAEALGDGPRARATFAQPSALVAHDGALYVVDAETSAIRVLRLDGGPVRTLVGKGLFDFGDVDGAADTARLQHPLAATWLDAELVVADSYNDKLKSIDPSTGAVRTLAGGGGALREPGGVVALPDGRLLVSDTNQHRLVVVVPDAPPAEALTPLAVRGVPRALVGLAGAPAADAAAAPVADARATATGALQTGQSRLVVSIVPPEGTGVTEGAPLRIRAWGKGISAAAPIRRLHAPGALPATLALTVAPDAAGPLTVELEYFWCRKGEEAACLRAHHVVEVDVAIAPAPAATPAASAGATRAASASATPAASASATPASTPSDPAGGAAAPSSDEVGVARLTWTEPAP